jgi:hypothetical protein
MKLRRFFPLRIGFAKRGVLEAVFRKLNDADIRQAGRIFLRSGAGEKDSAILPDRDALMKPVSRRVLVRPGKQAIPCPFGPKPVSKVKSVLYFKT